MSIENDIGTDPLFVELVKVTNLYENFNSQHIHSLDIIKKVGRYTMIPHYVTDCLMIALEDSPKTCWKLFIYLLRHISGEALDQNGTPKTFIREDKIKKATSFMEKTHIKSTASFYNAIRVLKEKKIIYIKDEKVFLNLFPLTWEVENNIRESIEKIIGEEIEKIKTKITEKRGA